jgi:hypothetical protein
MRARTFVAAAIATVALVAGLAPAASAAVDERTGIRIGELGEKPTTPEWHNAGGTSLTSGADCATVRANLASYRARGVERIECFTVKPGKAPTGGEVRAAPSCAGLQQEMWWYQRGGACVIHHIIGAIIDNQGKLLGEYLFEISQELNLQFNQPTFFDNVAITGVAAWGIADVPRTLTVTGTCDNGCATLDGTAWSGLISKGQTRLGQLVWQGVSGSVPSFTNTSYTWNISPPPGILQAPPLTWTGPGGIRCDNTLANVGPGCVMPGDAPTFYPSISVHREAAINIWVAQNYLPDGWGLYTPLTRQTNQSAIDRNRNLACNAFVARPDVANDSCDEYAFASSHQSARELGVPSGAMCAEIVPWQDTDGAWYFEPVQLDGGEACMVGHVPVYYNSLLGSYLSNDLYTPNRVIEGDQYYVVVTN